MEQIISMIYIQIIFIKFDSLHIYISIIGRTTFAAI